MTITHRLTRRATATAVALVASIAAVGHHTASHAAAAPADATEEVRRWTLTPAAADGAGNRSEFSYFADQGTSVDDAVTLFNLGNTQLTFRVYAADAFTSDNGEFDVQSGDVEPTDAGSWVTLEQELVTVPAGQQVTIPMTVSVPVDATPGDHAAGVVASVYDDRPVDPMQPVKVDFRTGTRLYLRVTGDLYPELAITDLATTYNPAGNPGSGSTDVSFKVENRGNVRLGGTATVTVNGPFGVREQSVELPPIDELLPGGDVTITTRIDDVPAMGMVFTTVRLVPDATVENGIAETIVVRGRTVAAPWSIVLVVVAIIVAAGALRARRRRERGPAASLSGVERRELQPL